MTNEEILKRTFVVREHNRSLTKETAYYITTNVSGENIYLHKDGKLYTNTGYSLSGSEILYNAPGFWKYRDQADNFLSLWKSRIRRTEMNNAKIEQCKRDIEALQKKLDELQNQKQYYGYGTKFTWKAAKDTVLMLVRTGNPGEFNLINVGTSATGNPWCGKRPFKGVGAYQDRVTHEQLEERLSTIDTSWIIEER